MGRGVCCCCLRSSHGLPPTIPLFSHSPHARATPQKNENGSGTMDAEVKAGDTVVFISTLHGG